MIDRRNHDASAQHDPRTGAQHDAASPHSTSPGHACSDFTPRFDLETRVSLLRPGVRALREAEGGVPFKLTDRGEDALRALAGSGEL